MFSVIRYESVIHEYDPWFNYRSSKYVVENGFYEFWNWFDKKSWYPLGRNVGGTVYPGIMWTAAIEKWILDFLSFPLDIRNVSVFTAPVFSVFQCISIYLLGVEATSRQEVGIIAALCLAVNAAPVSRGVAGNLDNESVSVFALVNTFYLWVKSVNTGSIFWSVACTLQYIYMVASWGGY